MSKIEIKKTELVWRGKYDDEGKLVPVEKPGPFPFQIVESINEPRVEKGDEVPKQTTLFDTWKGDEGNTFEDGWKNKLICGDNKFVMSSLLEKFAGKIDLIYIDPPFATGADFTMDIEVGEKGEIIHKEHSAIEEKAYRDTWGKGNDSFLLMMHDRLVLMKDLLKETGTIYIHLDYRMFSHIKILCEEIFGANNFRNEIIWHYDIGGRGDDEFAKKHDNILAYAKDLDKKFFDPTHIYIPYLTQTKGRKNPLISEEKLARGKIPTNVWNDIPVNLVMSQRLKYPTQKPEALLKRIINSTSKEGDLVADFFCGSGTTCAVAEKLGRRWIGVDLGRYAIHTTRKRLLEIENSKSLTEEGKRYGKKARPFEILNLGKYERQFWSVKAFGRKDEKQALYEYLAFILKLYGAEPIAGSSHIHGKKGNALVYIGAVDAPVTIQEVTDALKDTKDMGQKELHVLG